MKLLWFENLLLMRLWVWNAYLVLLWNRALAYPGALLLSGGPLSREFWQLTTPLRFVSYLGERGVLCVGNGWHFCTPVLINMPNITFEVARSDSCVFKKVLRKNNNVGPASQMVAHHYISIGPFGIVLSGKWPFWRRVKKVSPALLCGSTSPQTRDNHLMLFQCWASVEGCSSTLKQNWVNGMCLLMFLDVIEPALGCNAVPTLNQNWVGRPTSCVRV